MFIYMNNREYVCVYMYIFSFYVYSVSRYDYTCRYSVSTFGIYQRFETFPTSSWGFPAFGSTGDFPCMASSIMDRKPAAWRHLAMTYVGEISYKIAPIPTKYAAFHRCFTDVSYNCHFHLQTKPGIKQPAINIGLSLSPKPDLRLFLMLFLQYHISYCFKLSYLATSLRFPISCSNAVYIPQPAGQRSKTETLLCWMLTKNHIYHIIIVYIHIW